MTLALALLLVVALIALGVVLMAWFDDEGGDF